LRYFNESSSPQADFMVAENALPTRNIETEKGAKAHVPDAFVRDPAKPPR
jgi:hypothetical protein